MIKENIKILFQQIVETLKDKNEDAFEKLFILKKELNNLLTAYEKQEGEKPEVEYKELKRKSLDSFQSLTYKIYEDNIDLNNGEIVKIEAKLKLDLKKYKQFYCEIIWETKDKMVLFDFNAIQIESNTLYLMGGISRTILKTKILDPFKTKDPKEGIEKALRRFRDAEIFYLDIEKEKEKRIFEREKTEGEIDEDEEFDEGVYEFVEKNSYVPLSFNIKATKEDIANTKNRLGVPLPKTLINFYTKVGNGVGGGEQLQIFSSDEIKGLIDFLHDFIKDGMPYNIFKEKGSQEMGEDFGEALSESEQALVQSINSNYFVFAISWHDYQRIEILMFNKDHEASGLQVDMHEDQYIFSEYLENFHQHTKVHKRLNYFFNRFMDFLISSMIAHDFDSDKELDELFYLNE